MRFLSAAKDKRTWRMIICEDTHPGIRIEK